MRAPVRLLLTVGVTFGLGLTAPAAHAAYPGRNGLIAFEQAGDTYTIRPGGTTPKRITHDHASRQPRWSADGNRMAVSGHGDIWAMNPDGSGRRRITSGPETDFNPTWSPDGTQVAFARWAPGTKLGSIWAAPTAGGPARKISTDPPDTCASEPAWSSTGRYVVYQRARSCRGWNQAIVLVDLTAGSSKVLASGSVHTRDGDLTALINPDFLPDGTHVIFQGTTGSCISDEVKVSLSGKVSIFRWLTGCELDEVWSVAAAPDGRRYTGLYTQADAGLKVIGTNYWYNGSPTCRSNVCEPSSPDWQPLP